MILIKINKNKKVGKRVGIKPIKIKKRFMQSIS